MYLNYPLKIVITEKELILVQAIALMWWWGAGAGGGTGKVIPLTVSYYEVEVLEH